MTSDDDRIAYLTGDDEVALDAIDQEELEELRMLLADPAVWAEPGPGLEDAVVAAIGSEAPAGSVAPTAPVPPVAARPAAERARSRWFRPGPVLGVLAAAAAVVVALVIVTGGGTERDTLQAASADGALTAELTKFDSGWRIELDAPGLPRLDGGRFYQAWLRNEAGVLVTIGTFNEGDDVVLWAGVPPREFNTITVTEESADGVQDSSGVRVLAAPITED